MKNIKSITFLSISTITLFSLIVLNLNNHRFVKSIAECSHVGFHYDSLEPTLEEFGHKEFWVCCKCHESFLEEPEGTFADQDDQYMTGDFDENHIAYIAPDTFLLYGRKQTINGRVSYIDPSGKATCRIEKDGLSLLDYHKDGNSFIIGITNKKGTFAKDDAFRVNLVTKSDMEYQKFFDLMDGELKKEMLKKDGVFLDVNVERPDGTYYTVLPDTESLYIELGDCFDYSGSMIYLSSSLDQPIMTSFDTIKIDGSTHNFMVAEISYFSPIVYIG